MTAEIICRASFRFSVCWLWEINRYSL